MHNRKWVYFSDEEVQNLDTEFVAKLDQARHISGIPYKIMSGFRTPEKNLIVGGVQDSAHTKGLAVDLMCIDSRSASLIKKGLYGAGLCRIGNYHRLVDGKLTWAGIHVDYDSTKDQNVEWLKIRND